MSTLESTMTRPEWHERAACAQPGVNPDLWHYPDQEGRSQGNTATRYYRRAKVICASCPVLRQCRDDAIAAGEPHGVWGGLTEGEREKAREQLGERVAS